LFSVTPVAEIVFDAAPTHKTADELIGISSIFFNLYKDPLSTQSLVVPAITDTDRSRPAVRFRDVVILGAVGDARGNPVEFVGFKDGAFVNGWPAITTLQQLNTIPSLARSQDGRLIVTDDSIMTELILAVGMQVFLRMTQPRKTQVSDLMRMIAVATLVNAQWGLDRSFYLKWAGARPHASFAEVDYVPGYSWITSSRAPGMACINALKYYVEECIKGNHNFAWDRSRNKNRFIGREGGCGKIMDAAAFGLLFWQQPAVAAQLSALHSCISHPDIVSQVACGAYSYAIAEGIKGGSLNKIVLGMIRYAKQFSYNNARQEQTEWLLTPVAYRGKRGDKPFTVAQRIILARAAALKKVSPDIFFAKNTGFGAPDFIASVVFTAYWALQNKATISDAMNCCINTTASTDRDSLAAGVGRFLGSCKEFESGVNGAELAFLERHGDREKFAALCATWAQLL
jgi:ADP-ribosylglycohydrolase